MSMWFCYLRKYGFRHDYCLRFVSRKHADYVKELCILSAGRKTAWFLNLQKDPSCNCRAFVTVTINLAELNDLQTSLRTKHLSSLCHITFKKASLKHEKATFPVLTDLFAVTTKEAATFYFAIHDCWQRIINSSFLMKNFKRHQQLLYDPSIAHWARRMSNKLGTLRFQSYELSIWSFI
jgi:hypothetical protein